MSQVFPSIKPTGFLKTSNSNMETPNLILTQGVIQPHYALVRDAAVEAPTVKHALSSKHMVRKSTLYFQNHFKNWSKFTRMFSFKSTSGAFDKTMLFTMVVSASRRSSLILLVVEFTKEKEVVNFPCRASKSMLVNENAKIWWDAY